MLLATQVLIGTGIIMLFIGALSGIPMGIIRQSSPTVPKYLTMIHLSGYQQAPILLALGAIFEILQPEGWAADWGPIVLAVSAFLLVIKDLANYLQGVKDEFAEKSPGLLIGNIFGGVHTVGLVLCTIALVPKLLA